MALWSKECNITGKITSAGLSYTINGFIQFGASIQVTGYYDEKKNLRKPPPNDPNTYNISAYLMLTCAKGLNIKQIDSLKSALGWDGKDFSWLNCLDNYKDREIVAVLKNEEYEKDGERKTRLRVNWINPIGGMACSPAPEDVLAKMNSELASLTGSTPAPKLDTKAVKPETNSSQVKPVQAEVIQTTVKEKPAPAVDASAFDVDEKDSGQQYLPNWQ